MADGPHVERQPQQNSAVVTQQRQGFALAKVVSAELIAKECEAYPQNDDTSELAVVGCDAATYREPDAVLMFNREWPAYQQTIRRTVVLGCKIVSPCPTGGGLVGGQSGKNTAVRIQYVNEFDVAIAWCALEQECIALVCGQGLACRRSIPTITVCRMRSSCSTYRATSCAATSVTRDVSVATSCCQDCCTHTAAPTMRQARAMASKAQPYSPINQRARHGVLRGDDFDGSIGCRLLRVCDRRQLNPSQWLTSDGLPNSTSG